MTETVVPATTAVEPAPASRLPRRRRGITRNVVIGGAEFFITSNATSAGVVEIDFQHGKIGSTTKGLTEAVSQLMSRELQRGGTVAELVVMFKDQAFAPDGMTDDPEIRHTTSVLDYLVRRLALDWLPLEQRVALDVLTPAERAGEIDGGRQN